MSSLNILPDEILEKLLSFLLKDPRNFISLASTCKRLRCISNKLIYSKEWALYRPFTFNLSLPLDLYIPSHCAYHGSCTELKWRNDASCELLLVRGDTEQCYYHRLFCLLNSKQTSFSTIKFVKAYLSDRGCIKSFQDSLKLSRTLVELRIKALVELKLHDCDITLDWLNTILNQLNNLKYLTLSKITFTDPTILVEPRFLASKRLTQLKITCDETYRMTDSIFMYFLDNFPATELDLTSLRVEYHKRIVQRFYTDANTVDLYSVRPSEYILTYPMIILYLKKYQAVVKHFNSTKSGITFTCLKRILQDEDLGHLKITVKDCPLITAAERAKLFEQIDPDNLSRVIF